MQSTNPINNLDGNVTAEAPAAIPDARAMAAPKPNRAARRRDAALAKQARAAEQGASKRRLANFHLLQDEVEKLRASGKVAAETVDLFFKVALGRLFRRDFKDGEFRSKMRGILANLRRSPEHRAFRYKEELPEPAAEVAQP